MIDPQLPDAWDKAMITRSFRGAVYEIEIARGSEKKMIVDGEECSYGSVPVFTDGKIHKVIAVL